MKIGIVASLLIHAAALALAPSGSPNDKAPAPESVAASCRCDYEMTVTDSRPPHALTLGQAPPNRFAH